MTKSASNPIRTGKPAWLRRKLPSGPAYEQIRSMIDKGRLHTVCQEAGCPNQFECFSAHTATFLILGATCTRDCRFCNIEGGRPEPPDADEPRRVAEAAARMDLRYVVVTSVTRDDLHDGGAGHFAATIEALRETIPGVRVEVLIPDFQGKRTALETVLAVHPDVLNHNMETVRRLYAEVRPQADYDRSLQLLSRVSESDAGIPAKSGIMLGLGEEEIEIRQVITDIHNTGCRLLTIGQYLQPTPRHLPVVEFIAPEAFERWRRFALDIGFEKVAAGPFVRSSYHAGEMFTGGGETA
jgi:lipoic acid synthetase